MLLTFSFGLNPCSEVVPQEMEPQRKSRVIRRHTVSAQTINAISGDTWLLVCSNLFFSPACVLKLMQTSKTIWLAEFSNCVERTESIQAMSSIHNEIADTFSINPSQHSQEDLSDEVVVGGFGKESQEII